MKLRLNRSVRAEDNLDAFWLSAISSLLLLRFYLHLTNYPQVGGAHYHIAHMLYGGLLMLAAIALSLSFLGNRVRRTSAIVGGAGFGIFIDELGKFITKDADYFYRPAVGLIYFIFVVLYLTFNFLGRTRSLTAREYELNALSELEDFIRRPHAQQATRIRELLSQADPASPVTKAIGRLLDKLPANPSQQSWFDTAASAIRRRYDRFWKHRGARRVVGGLFLLATLIFPLSILLNLSQVISEAHSILTQPSSYPHDLALGQLISSSLAAVFAVIGSFLLTTSRSAAFEWFRRAVLVNLYLTEFFIFARIQFAALPGLILNLALLIGLQLALQEERRLTNR